VVHLGLLTSGGNIGRAEPTTVPADPGRPVELAATHRGYVLEVCDGCLSRRPIN